MQLSAARMLPVLHKYNMEVLLKECHVWLDYERPSLSPTEGDDAYFLR